VKEKKLRKLIQKPLRFHHQDIHEELDGIRLILAKILLNIEDIRATIHETPLPLRTETGGQTAEGGDPSGEIPRAETPDAG
jgi:hypothetical protein